MSRRVSYCNLQLCIIKSHVCLLSLLPLSLEYFATGCHPFSPPFLQDISHFRHRLEPAAKIDDPSRRGRRGQSSLEQRRGEVELSPVLELLFCLELGNTKCFCRQIVSFLPPLEHEDGSWKNNEGFRDSSTTWGLPKLVLTT